MNALKMPAIAVPIPEAKESTAYSEQLQLKVDQEILDMYLKLKSTSGRRGAAEWHRRVLKANLKALKDSGKL